VPATTLQTLAANAKSDAHPDLGRSTDPTQNAFRDADRFVKRWGLRFNIPMTTYKHSSEYEVPYLSPRALLTHHLTKAPELLFGGVHDLEAAKTLLQTFWDAYKLSHPEHQVFSEAGAGTVLLRTTIPVLFHGDEGRGIRKGNTTVCSLESPFGLDSNTSHKYDIMDCCQEDADDVLQCDFQNLNLKFHSYLTKFLVFLLPGKIYKNSDVMTGLLEVVFRDLRSLFYEGIVVGRQVFNVACVGCKGDLAWFAKLGQLDRCYLHLSNDGALMCHECLAGTPDKPFEDLTAAPAWSSSIYQVRPWSTAPTTGLLQVPFDKTKPEAILRRDIFHNTKVGVLQDYIASSMLLIAHLGYFVVPERVGNGVDATLGRMFAHFKLFCSAKGASPNMHGFNRSYLNAKTKKHYPWAKCKGSDAMLLLEWLKVLCTACLNRLLKPDDARLLEGIHTGATAARTFLHSMYQHGLWWKQSCAKFILHHANRFLKCYHFMAYVCLHELNGFAGFAMKPKLHMLCHGVHEIRERMPHKRQPSSLMFGCEANEDFIGRVCRLSRKVHQRRLCERVINMYLAKAFALRRKYLRSPQCGKKRKRN
ncbi:HERC1, partial [Symbiodinium sp. CCMP2592]